jgi:hypothetical protein
MKKLIFLTSLLSFIDIKAQVHVAVQQPEYSILYRGYNNVIIPEATGAEYNRLSAEGATVTPTTFRGKKGYFINPGIDVRRVSIVHEAKINGEWVSLDTVLYAVKPFPKPEIYNQTISKLSGAKFSCGLPEFTPFRRSFEVLNVNIEDQDYTGGTIPGKAVKSVKVGNLVDATIKVKDILSGQEFTIMSSFKVTN